MKKIDILVNENVEENDAPININDIIDMVNEKYEINNENMDNYIALEIDYNINYTVDQLKHIMKYYELSVRKKNKSQLIEELVIYEIDPDNLPIVSHRKYLWNCLDAIKEDKYLSKFVNINT
jgi:hypothetical protein